MYHSEKILMIQCHVKAACHDLATYYGNVAWHVASDCCKEKPNRDLVDGKEATGEFYCFHDVTQVIKEKKVRMI